MMLRGCAKGFVAIIAMMMIAPGIAAARGSGGYSSEKPSASEYLPMILKVKGVGRTEVTTIIRNEKIYVPLAETFGYIRVKVEYDSLQGVVTGYYLTKDTTYRIDANLHTIRIRNRQYELSSGDYFATSKDFYLSLDMMRSVFGLNFEYSKQALTLRLQPPSNLGIFRARERERQRRRLKQREVEPTVQEKFEQKPLLLGAGRLDWSIVGMQQKNISPRYSYLFRSGLQLLGGDFEMTGSGIAGKPLRRTGYRAHQRYVLPDNPYLQQITLGDFIPVGSLEENVLGVELTNRTPAQHIFFADELIEENIDAHRTVDVFDAGRIRYSGTVSESGQFMNEVPLLYGTNNIEIRNYDNWGDEDIRQYRVFVPRALLRPEEFRYSVGVGRLRLLNHEWFGSGAAQWGINSQLTVGVSLEAADFRQTNKKIYPSISATSRLTSALIADGEFSPNRQSQASLSMVLPSLAGGSISFTRFARNSLFNGRDAIHEFSLGLSLPFYGRTKGFLLESAYRSTNLRLTRERVFLSSLAFFFGHISPQVSVLAAYSDQYTTASHLDALRSSIGLRARLPLDVRFLAQTSYDHVTHRFVDATVEAGRVIGRGLSIYASYFRAFLGVSSASLRIVYGLPFMSSQNKITKIGDNYRFDERYNGSIGWSAETGDLVYDRIPHRVGFGDILMNPFLDANNNNVQDAGEERLTLSRLRAFSEAGAITPRRQPDGNYALRQLLAYQRYRVYLEQEGFSNPIWVPKFSSFEVTSLPNRIQRIDIPIVVGGIIHGNVSQPGDEARTPIEGIHVTIESQETSDGVPRISKTVATFSTGDFEFFPIPPGKYIVRVDPDQLLQLGYKVTPTDRTIEVRAVEGGDVIEGVNFDVRRY